MRLVDPALVHLMRDMPVYYMPIEVAFHEESKDEFDQYILKYVRENK